MLFSETNQDQTYLACQRRIFELSEKKGLSWLDDCRRGMNTFRMRYDSILSFNVFAELKMFDHPSRGEIWHLRFSGCLHQTVYKSAFSRAQSKSYINWPHKALLKLHWGNDWRTVLVSGIFDIQCGDSCSGDYPNPDLCQVFSGTSSKGCKGQRWGCSSRQTHYLRPKPKTAVQGSRLSLSIWRSGLKLSGSGQLYMIELQGLSINTINDVKYENGDAHWMLATIVDPLGIKYPL